MWWEYCDCGTKLAVIAACDISMIMNNLGLTPYLFDTYEEFIYAIADTMKEYHNSKVPVWRIIESRHYYTRIEWQELRQSYLDVKSILDNGIFKSTGGDVD